MLKNKENIVVQNFQILYIFVLRGEKMLLYKLYNVTIFEAILAQKW